MIVPCVCIATAASEQRVDARRSGRSRSEQKRADTWNWTCTGSAGCSESSCGEAPARAARRAAKRARGALEEGGGERAGARGAREPFASLARAEGAHARRTGREGGARGRQLARSVGRERHGPRLRRLAELHREEHADDRLRRLLVAAARLRRVAAALAAAGGRER